MIWSSSQTKATEAILRQIQKDISKLKELQDEQTQQVSQLIEAAGSIGRAVTHDPEDVARHRQPVVQMQPAKIRECIKQVRFWEFVEGLEPLMEEEETVKKKEQKREAAHGNTMRSWRKLMSSQPDLFEVDASVGEQPAALVDVVLC